MLCKTPQILEWHILHLIAPVCPFCIKANFYGIQPLLRLGAHISAADPGCSLQDTLLFRSYGSTESHIVCSKAENFTVGDAGKSQRRI